MNYLADTHVLLWSFLETNRLSEEIKTILLDENNMIYYSPESLGEISIKYGIIQKRRLKSHTLKQPYGT
jgi:PIN domain nuclease of toxin-antitoxin system